MQAADVSHTMQHFTTFNKWNTHLYHEVLAAYHCKLKQQQQQQHDTVGGTTQKEGSTSSSTQQHTPPPPPPINHPKTNWYESQIGFFDHYVIPLAQRLDACGVFAPQDCIFSAGAIANKERWILEGRECTRRMVEEAEGMELKPPVRVTTCFVKKKNNKVDGIRSNI